MRLWRRVVHDGEQRADSLAGDQWIATSLACDWLESNRFGTSPTSGHQSPPTGRGSAQSYDVFSPLGQWGLKCSCKTRSELGWRAQTHSRAQSKGRIISFSDQILPLNSGTPLGAYEILSLLDSGAMGEVHVDGKPHG
jgi:hypothetical protein